MEFIKLHKACFEKVRNSFILHILAVFCMVSMLIKCTVRTDHLLFNNTEKWSLILRVIAAVNLWSCPQFILQMLIYLEGHRYIDTHGCTVIFLAEWAKELALDTLTMFSALVHKSLHALKACEIPTTNDIDWQATLAVETFFTQLALGPRYLRDWHLVIGCCIHF